MKNMKYRIAAVLLLLAAVVIVGPVSEGIASTYATAPDDGLSFNPGFGANEGFVNCMQTISWSPEKELTGGAPVGGKLMAVATPIPPSVLLLGSGLLGILGIGLRRRKG